MLSTSRSLASSSSTDQLGSLFLLYIEPVQVRLGKRRDNWNVFCVYPYLVFARQSDQIEIVNQPASIQTRPAAHIERKVNHFLYCVIYRKKAVTNSRRRTLTSIVTAHTNRLTRRELQSNHATHTKERRVAAPVYSHASRPTSRTTTNHAICPPF